MLKVREYKIYLSIQLEFEPPSTFDLSRGSPRRQNYHMSDIGMRRSSDFIHSASPIRGVPGKIFTCYDDDVKLFKRSKRLC